MKVIECPDSATTETLFSGQPSIFLAGGITNCRDWQKEMIDRLKDQNVTLFNPRRASFDITDTSMSDAQIEWEHNHLDIADAILFWFPYETMCPITLFELGKYAMNLNKPLFVGCHPAYQRKYDVEKQLSLVRSDIVVRDCFTDLIGDVSRWLADYQFDELLSDVSPVKYRPA